MTITTEQALADANAVMSEIQEAVKAMTTSITVLKGRLEELSLNMEGLVAFPLP